MDYTDINSEDKLVQATFASTSTMSSARIVCTPGTTRHLAPRVHWAGIVTLIVLGRKGPHGFPFRRPHSHFPIH